LNFLDRLSKNTQISNFMKIRSVGGNQIKDEMGRAVWQKKKCIQGFAGESSETTWKSYALMGG
jgi:hypothetical protein